MKCSIVLFACLFVWQVDGQRTRDKMYDSVIGSSCFRRLNGTHTTGCTSSFRGSVGVLHLIQEQSDLDFVLKSPPAPPYTPIIYPYLFTRENVMKLKESPHIAGIVLIANNTKVTSFSHESRCPNQNGLILAGQTCDANKPEMSWNPYGTDLLHEDYPFPILFVEDDVEIKKLIDCFQKFNAKDLETQNGRALCSIRIQSFMSAAVNSEICFRRSQGIGSPRFCDPMQGRNVYATLFPREIVSSGGDDRKVNETEKFIMVSTRMDTTSMFDGIGPGALGSLVPLTTLFSTAHLLSRILTEQGGNHNVLFMLLNGETYDYVGSQRLIFDMRKGDFPHKLTYTRPINISNIDLVIDIGTLDDLTSIRTFHATDFDHASNFVNLFLECVKRHNLGINNSAELTFGMPPTSAQSFLRDNSTFPALVLQSKSSNKFYHSIYDDASNINFVYKNTSLSFMALDDLTTPSLHFAADSIQIKIRNMASALAFSLYNMVSGETYTDRHGASSILVDEMLYCYLKSEDCSFFKAISSPDEKPQSTKPLDRYVSVKSYLSEASAYAVKSLAFLVGQPRPEVPKQNCTKLPLFWFAGIAGAGECIYTTQNYSVAKSPAFDDPNYDWKSGKYSTWTESTWNVLSATIFLRPSQSHETLTLSIGIVTAILSFVFVFLINSKSDVLFGNSVSSVVSEPIVPPVDC